jgi:hypothetical protein
MGRLSRPPTAPKMMTAPRSSRGGPLYGLKGLEGAPSETAHLPTLAIPTTGGLLANGLR